MENKKGNGNIVAIIAMFFLFAMIRFKKSAVQPRAQGAFRPFVIVI